jgi:hypothetical protein
VFGASAEEMGIEAVAVLESEDMGHDGVVEKVLADVGGVNDGSYVVCS